LQQEQTSVIIAGGVVDTGEQFIAGVIDTCDFSPVSLIPVRNNQKA
jgi:hypothetical protein